MMKTIYKYFDELTRPRVGLWIQLPLWLIVFIIIIPVMAYADIIFVNKHTYLEYLWLCAIEVFLIYLGYFCAKMEDAIKVQRTKYLIMEKSGVNNRDLQPKGKGH